MNLAIEDLTRLFRVSERTIYRWIRTRGLPAYRVHHQYHFNRTDLLEWAASQRVNVLPDTPSLTDRPGSPLPTLAQALESGGIHHGVSGADKTAVLARIVELLRLPPRVDRPLLLEILRAREELGSTAIGDGVAIPHPRNPIMLNVEQPTMTLCFLAHPIDFGALDGQPVGIVFTLIAPTIHVHLNLLSRLMFVLRNPDFKALLVRQASPAEIMAALDPMEARLQTEAVPAPTGSTETPPQE